MPKGVLRLSAVGRRLLFAAGLFAVLATFPLPIAAQKIEEKKAPAEKPGPAKAQAPEVKRLGRLFRVVLPITGQTTDRLRQSVRRALDEIRAEQSKPVLIVEFVVPEGQSKFGAGSAMGSALDLAKFLSSDELSGATTVAYIPQTIQGHAVLAALACDEIIMSPDAEIGPAGVDEPAITDDIRAAYRAMANRRKKFPEQVAVKLVDPGMELLEVTTDVGVDYITPDGLRDLAKNRTVTDKKVLFRAGTPGRFSGTEARQKGFIGYTAANPKEVAAALDLPPESVQQGFVPAGELKAVRVDLRGAITPEAVDKARRMIQDAVQKGANLILVRIDSPGGSPGDSVALANYLAFDLDPGRVQTVAYVTNEARADAAIIALACDQIVLHKDAVFGGDGAYHFAKGEIDDMTTTVQELTKKKSRSWSLPAAIFDPNMAVARYTKPGRADPAFFGEKELAKQPDAKQWIKGEQVTMPGKVFSVKGADAPAYFPAARAVDDFAELKAMYNLENDPSLLEPTWVDSLTEFLSHPGTRAILLIIAFVALYVELHSPGISVPAFIALVCFALFFWGQFAHTTGWLAITLFIAGVVCVLLELFVIPGLGIFGLGGGVLILASLVLASQTFVIPRNAYEFAQFSNSLLIVGAAVVGVIAGIAIINRWLPETPIFGQVVLRPPTEEEAEAIDENAALTHFDQLVGMRGTATTPLVPGGKAKIGGDLYDVMTDGEFVPRNSDIEVVDVRGNWIVVRALTETA